MNEPALWRWLDSTELPTGIALRGVGAGLPLALWCAWLKRQQPGFPRLDEKGTVAQ